MTDWIERAREVAAKLAVDAVERDRRGGTPYHSLHDPLPYKRREVGAYALLGKYPTPTWYT